MPKFLENTGIDRKFTIHTGCSSIIFFTIFWVLYHCRHFFFSFKKPFKILNRSSPDERQIIYPSFIDPGVAAIQFSTGWEMGIDPRLSMYALGFNQYQLINDERADVCSLYWSAIFRNSVNPNQIIMFSWLDPFFVGFDSHHYLQH